MKSKTLRVVQLAVAGKFRAALFSGPLFTGIDQGLSVSALSVVLIHIDTLQIPNGGGVSSLHIVAAELTLGEANRHFVIKRKK